MPAKTRNAPVDEVPMEVAFEISKQNSNYVKCFRIFNFKWFSTHSEIQEEKHDVAEATDADKRQRSNHAT